MIFTWFVYQFIVMLSMSIHVIILRFYHQGSLLAKQVGAETYLECSAFTSEKSIHSVFRSAALACLEKLQPPIKPSPAHRKRLLHRPSKSEHLSSSFNKERTKSCSVMWSKLFAPWERLTRAVLKGDQRSWPYVRSHLYLLNILPFQLVHPISLSQRMYVDEG